MSADARRTAVERAAISRILRLRAGSNPLDVRALAVALFAVARMPGSRPGRQHEQQAGVAQGLDLVPLLRRPVRHRAHGCGLALALLTQLDLAVDHDQVGVLVDLVLL